MPFLLRQFADIYYEQIGTGAETIVLLNGFMRPGSDFKMLARHCEASGFSVVLIDNRGAGQSISYGEFSLEDLADDVAAVLDTLGVKKVNLLGISMGGMIGQLFAIRYPSRVAKIALVSTTADIEWNQKKEFTLQGDQQEVLAQLEDYVEG